ncbi:hypothetical protein FGIG_06033 [Fasciola gigantica]|uniref:Uncharacterized protein n=1 Tax=Fasciola gigantica TaxID=46835 RepID=A0A504Y9N2_FASGI|nr:hypothetical protein FGIG_06033 [Fasciola gigantica]
MYSRRLCLSSSDLDLPMSTDSFSSYQTATSTRVSDLSRGPGKPTFYFSVSALPAWARRKLTATHSKIGSDCESIDPPAQPSKRPTSTNRRLTKALTEPRVMVNDQCSSDSPTSSQTGSGQNSPRADRAGPLMSQSDYGVRMDLSSATTLPRMTDSRRTGSAAGSVAASRASVISAPSTPFRRDRSLTEFHSGHRALRQPKRHTVAITAGLQQQRGSPYASQYGSLRTRGHRIVQESISEIRSPKKIADDGQESRLLNEYNQPRIRHTIPLVGKSAPRTEGECLFVPTGPPSKPIPGSVSQTKQSDTTISAETSVRR